MTNPFTQNQTPQRTPPQQSNPFTGNSQQAPPQQAAPPAQPPGPEQFQQPGTGGGDRISGETWKSYVGSLVLFEVKRWVNGVTTENGVTDAATANVHVIDVANGPIFHENAMVFTPAVRDKLQDAAEAGGGSVLGRLKLVQSKQGSRSYVDLDPHSPEDVQTATRYLQWRAAQSMQQPAPQQQNEPPF